MKDITIKNENGVDISAKIMTIDELFHEWEKLLPGLPFYTWIDKLEECGIVTMREFAGMQPNDFIVKGLW